MTSILGNHINEVRPSLGHKCRVYKNERPYARKQARTKTVKEHCGKVTRILVKLRNNSVFGIPVPATHLDVLEKFEIPCCIVKAVGWELENGNEVWR